MFRYFHVSVVMALFIGSAIIAAEPSRTIRVIGEGIAEAPPDMATVNTGVTSEAETATAALNANNKAMQDLLKTVREFQIAEKDVQTTRFDVTPVYKHDQEGQSPPNIVAYRVTNRVHIQMRQLANLGKFLDALVQAGSNQISGVQFEIADPAAVRDQARRRAIEDAQRRAKLYADAAGVSVGKVLAISEQTNSRLRPVRQQRLAAAAMASVPVASGTLEFREQVHMEFAIEDKAAESTGR